MDLGLGISKLNSLFYPLLVRNGQWNLDAGLPVLWFFLLLTRNLRMVWVGTDNKAHPVLPPSKGRDTFRYPRLLQAASSLALDTSKVGQRWNPIPRIRIRTTSG